MGIGKDDEITRIRLAVEYLQMISSTPSSWFPSSKSPHIHITDPEAPDVFRES